jgi:murein DD-endopeptidase MepM/ murein hydrolase activator NlpD
MALVSPAPGKRITQPFNGHNINEGKGWLNAANDKGRRSSFTGGTPNTHDHLAIDLATPIGFHLVAPQTSIIVAQGTIARFVDGSLDGEHYLIAVIRRTATQQTCYLLTHLSGWLLKVGNKVQQGNPIAVSGNSGRTTGPHTHFELAVLPRSVEPAHYFWHSTYYRYNPLTFYAGGRNAGASMVVPNV